MKLEKKKALAARTLNVGMNRIAFNTARLSEIKEAITKQDIKDLHNSGAIIIKHKIGRRTVQKRKGRRRAGSVRQKVKTRKADYVKRTRKLRAYLKNLKEKGKISREEFLTLRKEIRTSAFKNLPSLKERMGVKK